MALPNEVMDKWPVAFLVDLISRLFQDSVILLVGSDQSLKRTVTGIALNFVIMLLQHNNLTTVIS